jgi:hypothetical protein
MKKHTNTKLRVKLQTVRQLTDSDRHAVVGGSSVVYTCTTTTGAPTGQPTVDCSP